MLRQFQSATFHLQLEVRRVMRLAQLLDAGIAAKRAPAEHRLREIKRLGHDQWEIKLLAGQHHLVDEGRTFFRQALARLIAHQWTSTRMRLDIYVQYLVEKPPCPAHSSSSVSLRTEKVLTVPVPECSNQTLHFRPPVVFACSIIAILDRDEQP